MNVSQAIKKAERILPGVAAPDDAIDPRWQAINNVGEFIESHPEEVWQFTVRWGKSCNSDLRAAVSTCLLEHILEYHFAEFFPRTNELVQKSSLFADTFLSCSKFGQSKLPENAKLFDQLKKYLSEELRRGK
jgi:hypothetical protein